MEWDIKFETLLLFGYIILRSEADIDEKIIKQWTLANGVVVS